MGGYQGHTLAQRPSHPSQPDALQHWCRFRRTRRYGIFHRGRADHSALMPANLTTLAHFSVSSAINLPKSAGEPASAGLPRSASCALIFGSASAVLISLLSLSMTSVGVLLGEPRPNHPLAS